MMTVFTEEEMLLLAVNDAGERSGSLAWLKELYGNLEHDPETQELIETISAKLEQMTDEEYLQIDFTEYDAWIEDMMAEIDQELAEISEADDGDE